MASADTRAAGTQKEITIGEARRVLGRFEMLARRHESDDEEDTTAATQEDVRKELLSLKSTLEGYAKALAQWRSKQGTVADDFSILEVLGITGNELRHSMMLAWLLDHDLLRYGTHAQGALGFSLFLEALRLPREYASTPYWVRREVKGDESRVDLEIAATGSFLIHIENKIWSGEGEAQTDREWKDVRRRASRVGANSVHAFFLTPDGRAPLHPGFIPISWSMIATVLRDFSDRARPRDVKLFCSHYARSLELFVVRKLEEESADGDGNIQ